MRDNAWRYVAIAVIGILGGLVTGQFVPNRNIVTADQLAPLTAAITADTAQIQSLTGQVSEMRGELQAQKLLSSR